MRMLAVAVPSVPPFVDETLPVMLVSGPDAVPVTFTVIVHEPLTGIVPLASTTEAVPAVAVVVPPQVLTNPLGVATSKPAGKISVIAAPVKSTALGFLSVRVREVTPPTGSTGTPNALLTVGGTATKVVAVAGVPVSVTPAVFDAVGAEVVLTAGPAAIPLTVAEIMQILPAARVNAGTVIVVVVLVALQLLVTNPKIARLAGKVSVNWTLVSGVALMLLTTMANVVVAPSGKLAWANDLATVGGNSIFCALAKVPSMANASGARVNNFV